MVAVTALTRDDVLYIQFRQADAQESQTQRSISKQNPSFLVLILIFSTYWTHVLKC